MGFDKASFVAMGTFDSIGSQWRFNGPGGAEESSQVINTPIVQVLCTQEGLTKI